MVYLEIRVVIPLAAFLSFRTLFIILGLLCFCMNFEAILFSFCEESHWDFGGYCTGSVDYFDKLAIFTILILLIHKHGMSFNFVFSSVSSSSALKFSLYTFYTSWSGLFQGIFEAFVNGIVFLVSFSLSFWLRYKMDVGFCVLILYPTTSLNVFISCRSFLVVISSADKNTLASFMSSLPPLTLLL